METLLQKENNFAFNCFISLAYELWNDISRQWK